jgi:hypothetical protein
MRQPLRLTFRAREGDREGGDGDETAPPSRVWGEGGGRRGDRDGVGETAPPSRVWSKGGVQGCRALRLAFGVRERREGDGWGWSDRV